jgi:Putative zinc ribbon domain
MNPGGAVGTSCGMPLRTAGDHAAGDETKAWCRPCAGADGALKIYEEVLAGMTNFLTRTQGLDEQVARGAAVEMMARQPGRKV